MGWPYTLAEKEEGWSCVENCIITNSSEQLPLQKQHRNLQQGLRRAVFLCRPTPAHRGRGRERKVQPKPQWGRAEPQTRETGSAVFILRACGVEERRSALEATETLEAANGRRRWRFTWIPAAFHTDVSSDRDGTRSPPHGTGESFSSLAPP